MMTGTGQMICLKPMMRQPLYFFEPANEKSIEN